MWNLQPLQTTPDFSSLDSPTNPFRYYITESMAIRATLLLDFCNRKGNQKQFSFDLIIYATQRQRSGDTRHTTNTVLSDVSSEGIAEPQNHQTVYRTQLFPSLGGPYSLNPSPSTFDNILASAAVAPSAFCYAPFRWTLKLSLASITTPRYLIVNLDTAVCPLSSTFSSAKASLDFSRQDFCTFAISNALL